MDQNNTTQSIQFSRTTSLVSIRIDVKSVYCLQWLKFYFLNWNDHFMSTIINSSALLRSYLLLLLSIMILLQTYLVHESSCNIQHLMLQSLHTSKVKIRKDSVIFFVSIKLSQLINHYIIGEKNEISNYTDECAFWLWGYSLSNLDH